MWDLPRPGLEPVSPALAGRFSTTAPPGKPQKRTFFTQYYSAMRKKEIPSQVTSIDLEGIMLSEIYKSDRERQILYDITDIWKLKKPNHGTKVEWCLPGAEGWVNKLAIRR